MRKSIMVLFIVASINVFAQGKTLFQVQMVKPKIGQVAAFEAAWKAHVAKFHKDDKRAVYEVLTGDRAGYYQLVDGPTSYADMDVERGDSKAHDLDYETTVATKIETESGAYIYRFADTLSYNGNVAADKYSYTVYNVKLGKMPDLIAEAKRSIAVNTSINSPSSYNAYLQMFAGSAPQLVVINNLKDGFKQLELNYFPGMTDKFKEAYIKMYSQAQWDKRQTLLPEITTSYETYLGKRRDDLSSK
ncbi:MAG TPA: hypothetical protein VNT20_07300 [Flavisolibacter sp.]|jgi:hypothetical protein|nr:hypothetical protein [Flavisolibacter sp.]